MVAYFSLRTSRVLYTTCSRSAASFLLIIILLVNVFLIWESGRSRTATSMVNSYLIDAPYIAAIRGLRLRPCHSAATTTPLTPHDIMTDWQTVRFFRVVRMTWEPTIKHSTLPHLRTVVNIVKELPSGGLFGAILFGWQCKGTANFCNCKFLVIVLSKFIVNRSPTCVNGILIFG